MYLYVVPGRWAPGCPLLSCSGCRCAGTSQPGPRSRGRAAPVQPSGEVARSGPCAPASHRTPAHGHGAHATRSFPRPRCSARDTSLTVSAAMCVNVGRNHFRNMRRGGFIKETPGFYLNIGTFSYKNRNKYSF